MRKRFVPLVGVALAVGLAAAACSSKQEAPAAPTSALTGVVSSADEGNMEGVLVTARRVGSTIAVTVVSGADGRYSFPVGRLEPGQYTLRTRAVGYDLDTAPNVSVDAGKAASLDLKLKKTDDVAAQLTNAERLASFPGTDEQKTSLRNCAGCHTMERIVRSQHGAAEFSAVVQRMGTYTNQSTPLVPQVRKAQRLAVQQSEMRGEEAIVRAKKQREELASYLATLNLSNGGKWGYDWKTLPRPKGRATQVIVTEYDLPRETRQPHDVIVDKDGTVWYDSFGEQVLGRMDPKTGKVTEYQLPTLRPGYPLGCLALRFDEDGNPWLGMMFQGAVAKFDRKTEKFQIYSLPPDLLAEYTQMTEVNPDHSKVDGKVWTVDAGTYTVRRLDVATGKWEVFKPYPDPSPNIYDIITDAQNNVYFTTFGADKIGKIDAKTGKISYYQTPTPQSNPRRGSIDAQGRVWFGEFRANKVGMFDPKTEQFKEWDAPTKYTFPYDVTADRNGDVWTGSMFTDRVARLNSKTGEWTEYLMPRNTNIRKVWVDDSRTPVTFWTGSNHGAAILKVEPHD